MSHIVVITGVPTPGSRLNGITEFVEQRLVGQGHQVSHIKVYELPAEALLHAQFKNEAIISAVALVQAADAVVVASPVYKAAYSGILKTFLELIPETGLNGKIILPLFIGGTIAHLLSIDYALKPVLNALGARHILGGVYAVDKWVARLENGGYELTEELRERLERSTEQLVEELLWQKKRTVNS